MVVFVVHNITFPKKNSFGWICNPTVKNQRICNPHRYFPENSLSLRPYLCGR